MQGIYHHLKTYRWPYLFVVSVLVIDVLLRFFGQQPLFIRPMLDFPHPIAV